MVPRLNSIENLPVFYIQSATGGNPNGHYRAFVGWAVCALDLDFGSIVVCWDKGLMAQSLADLVLT